MLQTKARIFLNEQRTALETGVHRCLNSFDEVNDHSYPGKQPFSDLIALRDETLAASNTVQQEMPIEGVVVLVPIVGFLSFEVFGSEEKLLRPGEVLVRRLEKGAVFSLRNPYADENINYLQLWFNKPYTIADEIEQISSFNLDKHYERLVDIISRDNNIITGYITAGKYKGRSEAVYHKRINNSVIFAFVIEGVFEVENRLLHQRDGLAIWDTDTIEAEALSSGAILMLIELSQN